MEEDLREAACTGNMHAVQKLLRSGVNINSQNSMNGWTALHWACKRGHTSIVMHLLNSGADANIRTHKGDYPAQLATISEIRELLSSCTSPEHTTVDTKGRVEPLPIVPNYLQNPVFPYHDIKVEGKSAPGATWSMQKNTDNEAVSGSKESSDHHVNGVSRLKVDSPEQEHTKATETPASTSQTGLTLKARIVGSSGDKDFVEVEVPSLTYQSLLGAICEELELSPSDVAKIRKLPNILVRKDKDVQRLREGQELEVIRS